MPIVMFLPQCIHALHSGLGIRLVPGDSSYIITSAESDTYERTKCILGEAWEKEFLKVADYEIPLIQAVSSEEGF